MKKTTKDRLHKTLVAILAVIWVGVVCLAVQVVFSYLMFFLLGRQLLAPVWSAIYSAITYLVAALIIIKVPAKIKKHWKSDREELGLSGLPTFTDIGLAIIGFIASILISALVINLLSGFSWFNASEAQDVGFNNLQTGIDRAIAFIALAVIAPIAEEIIFRGWLYGKLRGRYHAVISMALVAILFGALHGQLNVAVNVGILSVIMCLEREITGTVYAGIITHIIKNSVAFFMLFVLHF